VFGGGEALNVTELAGQQRKTVSFNKGGDVLIPTCAQIWVGDTKMNIVQMSNLIFSKKGIKSG
jgi:hypothetical protein